MLEQRERLLEYLEKLHRRIDELSADELYFKEDSTKWSKKEIVGHLIDSANANILRFTEIQFSLSPYEIKTYQQKLLVESNKYQEKNTEDLLNLITVLNKHIAFLIEKALWKSTDLKIAIDKEVYPIDFLVKDYVDHFIHHFKQI